MQNSTQDPRAPQSTRTLDDAGQDDDVTEGPEAQRLRDKRQRQDKPEGERAFPDRDPAKKKTGEF